MNAFDGGAFDNIAFDVDGETPPAPVVTLGGGGYTMYNYARMYEAERQRQLQQEDEEALALWIALDL